ncbi:YheV family putative zinc ribbon protein [Ketobacter sp.]|uniref:YheV family putative zinc ribbon protein n=1 Tax=Ketobacter sp. TaxID=2083498 RepID=UPI000F2B37BE|nr:YheV family putative zinc ribbon protein [Ketobacter sp.]RLT99266.1 MAG: YheV family putative metal-binding protein [Ketobacter sp.]
MRKMFIAGAKCPQCEKEDKIFVYRKDGEDLAECNACGYISVRPKEVEPMPETPPAVDGVVRIIK